MDFSREDLDASGITQADITDRKPVGNHVLDWRAGQREKFRTVWSD